MNVVAGYPSDIVDVPSSSVPTSVSTTGGLGVVHVRDDPTNPFLQRVANILAPVTVSNGSLVIDDSLDNVAREMIVGAGAVTGLAPTPINYSGSIQGLTINGGYAANTFLVTGLPSGFYSTTTLNAGTAASDAVTVYGVPQGSLDVVGQGPPTSLTLDDSGLLSGATYTLTATSIARGSLGVTYSGLSALTLYTALGLHTVNVQGLDRKVTTSLIGGAGTDSFDVTNAGQVPDFYGGLFIDGGGGFNYLTFDDSADQYITTPTITAGTFTRGAGTANYTNIESFTYDTAALSNGVSITGTNATTSYAVNGGGGSDGFYVTPTDSAGNISILGPLALTGGGGTDGVSLAAPSSASGLSYTVSGNSVAVSGGGVTGGLVTYGSVESLNVNTGAAPVHLTVNGTSVPTTITTGGGDTVDVTPAAADLGALAGGLTLNAGQGSALNLYDQNDPSFNLTQYFFSNAGLTRLNQVYDYTTGTPVLVTKQVNVGYGGLGSVVLHASGYNNVVQIKSTAPGTPVTIDPSPATLVVAADQTDPTAPVIVEPGGTEPVAVAMGGAASAGGARVLFGAGQTIGALTVGPNGTASVAPGGAKVLTTPSLSISAGGKVDLADGLLKIQYGTAQDPDATVASWIGQGAIYSSTLAAGHSLSHRDDLAAQTEVVGAGPSVASFAVNGGAAQRSRVTSLSVAFNEPVTLAAGAMALARVTIDAFGNVTSSTDVSSGVTWSSPDGGTTWVASVVAGGAADGGAGSLSDGVYRLTVRAAAVTDPAGGLPLAGGDESYTFHRLFGDTDGNKTVNALDYARFKQAFGSSIGSGAYDPSLDFDGNGTLNAADYAQFKNRFGKTFTYP